MLSSVMKVIRLSRCFGKRKGGGKFMAVWRRKVNEVMCGTRSPENFLSHGKVYGVKLFGWKNIE